MTAPDGWYECKECGSWSATKQSAEDCCRGRHNKEEKEVYKPDGPQSKSPHTWV